MKINNRVSGLLFLIVLSMAAIQADDVTVGELSARLEDLEKKLEGKEGGAEEDKDPGARVTADDLEYLKEQVRDLQSNVTQLKKENEELRTQVSTKTPSSSSSKKGEVVDRPSKKTSAVDDDTVSILQELEQSAPGNEDAEDRSLKKGKKGGDIEAVRDAATQHAEETNKHYLPTKGNAQAQYNEAETLFNKGAYKEAEGAFDDFIASYPDHELVPQAMFWKGDSCLRQEKYKEAKILFVTAYKKNPKGPTAPDCLLRLGEALAMQGKTEDACTAWKKLKSDFPHMTDELQGELKSLKKKYGCK